MLEMPKEAQRWARDEKQIRKVHPRMEWAKRYVPLVLLFSARPVQNFSPSGYGPVTGEKDMPLFDILFDRSDGQ